jgi:hypothetical protein
MGLDSIVDNFKTTNIKPGKVLGFSLLPLLIKELIDAGLDDTALSGSFYKELASKLFEGECEEVVILGMESLMFLGKMIPPKQVLEAVSKPQAVVLNVAPPVTVPKKSSPQAIMDGVLIRTEHLSDNIPDEDEEGDPFYISPEDQISLKPEDCAPMEHDDEFCAMIGYKRLEK